MRRRATFPRMASPIILTLQVDDESQQRFEAARERWFPPKLNRVPAHLTLFHALPGEDRERVAREVAMICARQAPFPVQVAELIKLGGGMAYRLRSKRLDTLRADLARAFEGELTKQDASGFRAHVTIQNKVSRDTAAACRAVMEAEFAPWEATAEGVQIWSYEGGPWGALGAVAFARPPAAPAVSDSESSEG